MTEIRTALEMREAAAKMARNWLETWGEDLACTRDSYIEATRTGKHTGRTISTNFAKRTAEQFNERADAVHQCGALLERDIRAIPIFPETDARDEALRPREGSHMTREQLIEAVRRHLSTQYPICADDHAARAILALIERHAVIVPIEPGEGEIRSIANYIWGDPSAANQFEVNQMRAALLKYHEAKT